MRGEILPVEVSDLVTFSSSLNSYAARTSKATFAGVSKNGLWMWVVCDTTINIYHTENSVCFGSYCFGESLKNPSARITAVTEFCSTHISFPCLLIAVNHDHESLICMYDINNSKVVRAVLVPDMVLCLEVISGNGGACKETLHLFMQLRYMFGIVAVGTSAGHLYFLDLCLDEEFCCDENLPNITFVLKKYELLPERRESAIAMEQHVFMLLNDQSVRNGSFEFESRSSSLGHFPYGKVHVTALKYMQSTVTLAMGFNFGGIQLWDLQDLCLLYTVANQPEEQPIISFAFQEPENDPRHFCYLWIIRGNSANERPEDFSVATMYSLVYDKRTYVESFGYLYTELRNCFKRFEYRLTSDPFFAAQSSSAAGSCLLSCQTVCQNDESHCLEVSSPNDSDTAPENMSLCFLSWIVWSNSENTPTSYHLALFDLNQWYRAEMPSSNFRSDPSDLNPYFAHFSLEEVAQNFDLDPILGLYIIPHSIQKFKYISPSEEFFFPSSLDFQTIAFSANGICKSTFMGVQKHLLCDIADLGPNVLVNPKEFYSNLTRYGLVSDSHTTHERVPLIVQRETIMQLALEYHIPVFFMKCLKEWRYADSIQEGCTSRELLNWAWKKVIQIKSSIDKLNIPLFNCSGSDIDKAPLKCLYNYRRQLDVIDTIIMGYMEFVAPRTEQGIQELKCRKDVVFSINMYLQVVLWLRSVHVLPEVCEGEETEKNVLYPVNALLDSYSKRRNQLRKIHSSIGSTDILLIDGLVKEAFNENTWQEKGGNGIYPPPSIYAAVSCYLLDDVHLDLKHSLMYYILLDICNASHNVKSPLISEVKKFPAVFGLSQSVTKLVKAYWYLDQFNFQVAIKKLLDPAVESADILPWQHHRVIKSFLYQREAHKALKYISHMKPPEISIEDMKLRLSVLLARGAVIEAFHYQRSKQSIGCGTELLNHLFLGCQEMHKLKDIIYMPLNGLESSTLVKFLSESEDPRAQETLVMYYLLHCNYFDASKVNQKLATSSLGRSTSTRDRTTDRDALVEGFLSSVPKTEKNLVDEINRFPSIPLRKTEPPKPLSLSIKSIPMKQITYSDILNSLISNASSAMCAPYLDPQTPLKSVTRSSYENIPFLRPPLTPECTKIPAENIHSTPVSKRMLTSPTSEFSSPTKRSRLLDNAPFKTPLSKKKIPKHLARDVASLLQSPPIHRRSSNQMKDIIMKDSTAAAPQGILKKKAEPTTTPASDRHVSKTPSVLSDTGEDSDSEENNEMIVDDEPNDAPGRQIRFSVPSKEDSNISASMESPVSSISHEHSSFMRKPVSSLGKFDSDSKGFMNVTQRKTLLGLTREPLKTHLRESPDKSLPLSESSRLVYEKPSVQSANISSSTLQYTVHHKTTELFDDISDSDSCSATEGTHKANTIHVNVEPKKDAKEISSVQLSSNIYSSSSSPSPLFSVKVTEQGLQPSLNVSNIESALNNSGSSSGNSSYNSASERSFIITPRRPLRDNSRNTSVSSTSMISAQEDEKDKTLLVGDEVEMVVVEDNSDDDNVGDEDISIIAELTCPQSQEIVRPSEKVAEEECVISQDIIMEEETTLEVVEEANNQHYVVEEADNQDSSTIFEVEKCDSSDNVLVCQMVQQHSNEAILDVEQDVDSQNKDSEAGTALIVESSYSSSLVQTVEEIIGVSENSSLKLDEQPGQSSEPDNVTDKDRNDSVESQVEKHLEEHVLEMPVIMDSVKSQVEKHVEECASEMPEIIHSVESQVEKHPAEHASEMPVIMDSVESRLQKHPEEHASDIADIMDSVDSQVEKHPEDHALELSSFAKDIPIPNSPPPYVPIKERISRSQQSASGFSKFDDDDDETYPSLLLQEHMELEKYGEVFESKKSDILEHPCASNSSAKPTTKLETIAETSNTVGTELQTADISSVSPPTLTSTKDFSQKLTERFDFLSTNSDFYENKLYKETMNLLKESDIPQRYEIDVEKQSRRTRTFIFKKEDSTEAKTKTTKSEDLKSKPNEETITKKEQITETKTNTTKSEDLKPKINEETSATSKGFLESWQPETYEQFSFSIQKGRSDNEDKETLKSSPNIAVEKSTISIFKTHDKSEQSTSGIKGRKKQESTKKDTSAVKKEKSTIKKAKEKGKGTKKIEFSFAEPHSPAGPEILEALTTPSQYPVGSFMFSPPLTRGRLRQKKLDESLGSSFASVTSETSFAKAKKPPVDPILEEIMAERAPESQKLMESPSKSKTRASTKKKTLAKKSTKTDIPHFDISDTSLNTTSLAGTDSPGPSTGKPVSSTKTVTKHKMVLRQTKTKPRTEQLF